jgi:hypothetical protein
MAPAKAVAMLLVWMLLLSLRSVYFYEADGVSAKVEAASEPMLLEIKC